jgi:hypothetical protein
MLTANMQLYLVVTMVHPDAKSDIQTANEAAQAAGIFPFCTGQSIDQLLVYAGDTQDIMAAAAGASAAGPSAVPHSNTAPVVPFIMCFPCVTCGVQVDIDANIGDKICGRTIEWVLPDPTNQCCFCEHDKITAAGGEICAWCQQQIQRGGKGKAVPGGKGGRAAQGGRAAGGAGGAAGAARGPASAKAPLPGKDNHTCQTPGCFRFNWNYKPGINCCLECRDGKTHHSADCQAIETSRYASLMPWPAEVIQAVGDVITVNSDDDVVGRTGLTDSDDDVVGHTGLTDSDDDDPNAAGPRMPGDK